MDHDTSRAGVETRLQAGGTGVRTLELATEFLFSKNSQTESSAHPVSYLVGARVLSPGQSGRKVQLTTHFRPRLRMREAAIVLILYVFMMWTGTHFTLTLRRGHICARNRVPGEVLCTSVLEIRICKQFRVSNPCSDKLPDINRFSPHLLDLRF